MIRSVPLKWNILRMWNNDLLSLWNLILSHQVKRSKSPRARRHFTLRSSISRAKRIWQIPQEFYFIEKKRDSRTPSCLRQDDRFFLPGCRSKAKSRRDACGIEEGKREFRTSSCLRQDDRFLLAARWLGAAGHTLCPRKKSAQFLPTRLPHQNKKQAWCLLFVLRKTT